MTVTKKTWAERVASASVAVSLLGGCGGGETSRYDDVGELKEPINRGVLVTSNVPPYDSVVHIVVDHPNDAGEDCSALKIAGNRYLTAAHCLRDSDCTFFGNGGRIFVSNALAAQGASTTITAQTVYLHPSYVHDFDACSIASSHSYDIAIFETNGDLTPTIPVANAFWPNFVGVGASFREVGYGKDVDDNNRFLQKQYANYASVSDTDVSRYAHQILTSESQSAGVGDSGAPLFYAASPGTWRVAGVTKWGNGDDGRATAQTGFTRVANVGAWLTNPHNNSAPNNGDGFFQNVTYRQCMLLNSSAVGTPARLGECEGYNRTIHSQIWSVVASGSYFQLRTNTSGVQRCLDIQGSTNNVVLASCGTGQGQHWTIAPFLGSSSYRTIKNRLRNLYLDDTSGADSPLRVSQDSEARWLFYR